MALPPKVDFFGCELLLAQNHEEATATWVSTRLREGPVSLSHPEDWSIKHDGRSLSMEAPDGQSWLSLRWGKSGDKDYLDRVRRDVELFELGPNQLTPLCQRELSSELQQRGGWLNTEVNVTRRAFGMKRRSFALFANHSAGTLTLIVTVKWKKRSEDALVLARRLLNGIRVDPRGAQVSGQAHASNAPKVSPPRP